MQVSITGRHVNLTDEHRQYVQDRLERLKKFFEDIMDVHVVVDKQKHRVMAEITILVNGITMHGEDVTENFYSSIDSVVNKIERQIKKHKDRFKARYRGRGAGPDNSIRYKVDVLSGSDLEQGSLAPRIIRTRTLALKPLSLDEAVMQMDLLNQDFLVFRHHETGNVNVIYRREDGDYHLVEPEAEA